MNENGNGDKWLDKFSKRVVIAVSLAAAAIFLCNATFLILVYIMTS